MNPAWVTTDVGKFDAALRAAGRAEGHAARIGQIARAVELYSGELLPGFFEDWILQERQWLAERCRCS